jgi:amidophosphoribosyltransferase
MCGIVGIFGAANASTEVHQALLMLQHRGQDSAGILSSEAQPGKFHLHKNLGQVSQVFAQKKDLDRLHGSSAIGHTRYSTIGENKESDLQPMALSLPVGIGMVHNGNVSNYEQLRKRLTEDHRFFMSDNDVEMILQLMAESYSHHYHTNQFDRVTEAVKTVFEQVEGGYSVIGLLGSDGMFAFRDPHGIRPLILGHKKNENGKTSYCLTSESCALKFLGYEVDRDIKAGELIWINQAGEVHTKLITKKTPLPCMFEWIYFSGADSTLENKNVYEVRLKLGELLSAHIPADLKIDVVAPVPDTSRPAAISLAEKLKVPFREVLIKNRYIQRSFITSGQDKRQMAVKLKFSVIDELVQGKNVLLVDDSIVRGTTSKKIIQLLKQHGANQVFIASTCPPVVSPCYYGIDFPSSRELIAHERTSKQVAEELGADGVFYSSMNDLSEALKNLSFCKACLNGEYAYPVNKGVRV